MAFTDPIDISTPNDDESTKLGDDRIRETKRAVQEILNIDHDSELAGNTVDSATSGYHTLIHLKEQGSPAPESDVGKLYTQDKNGVTELYYTDSAGNETQITVGGKIQGTSIADNSVDEDTIRLNSDSFLLGRNAADSADINMVKVNVSNEVVIGHSASSPAQLSTADPPLTAADIANKAYVDDVAPIVVNGIQAGANNTPTVTLSLSVGTWQVQVFVLCVTGGTVNSSNITIGGTVSGVVSGVGNESGNNTGFGIGFKQQVQGGTGDVICTVSGPLTGGIDTSTLAAWAIRISL